MGKSRIPEDTTWPAWFYGPEGQSRIFDSAEEVPSGWADHPSAFAEQGTEADAGRAPEDVVEDTPLYNAMSMDELRKHLDGKNISYAPTASKQKLISLLRTARPDQGHPEN